MTLAVNDSDFAARCQQLYAEGTRATDEQFFNDEYYRQHIRVPEPGEPILSGLALGHGGKDHQTPELQVANGCLTDQMAGQYMAHILGLGHLTNAVHIQSALRAIYRHNFLPSLHSHWNNLRSFALTDERALVICTWPYNDAPPSLLSGL